MYHCPFCENFTYDWNDTDSLETKETTIRLLNDHIRLVHPDEDKPTPLTVSPVNDDIIKDAPLPVEASEPPTVSEVII